MRLVTIVAEETLGHTIIGNLEEMGIHGYTYREVRGMGKHGDHTDIEHHAGNLKIEVVATRHTADEILELLHSEYLSGNAVIVYVSEVQVVRQNKFL
jgi:nitrogen regulatory protein PII